MESTIMETVKADEQQALTLLDHAKSIVIITNEDRISAEKFIQELSAAEKKRFAYLDPERATAWENYLHHKQRLDDAINPLVAARRATKQKCIDWDREQERIRQEAERRANEEARRQEEEARLAAAVQAEAEGDTEAAEQILDEPTQAPTVILPKTAPAPSRLSAGQTRWYAEVTDLKALCRAIADGRYPVTLVEANMPALNKMAVALKSALSIPGVVAKSKVV